MKNAIQSANSKARTHQKHAREKQELTESLDPFWLLAVAYGCLVTTLFLFGVFLLGLDSPYEDIVVGAILGLLYGQVAIAATWSTFGPTDFNARLPISGAWIITLCLTTLFISSDLHSRWAYSASMLVQWGILCLLLAMIAWVSGWRIRHHIDVVANEKKQRQFTILQLFIVMTVAVMFLAVWRIAFSSVRLQNLQIGPALALGFMEVVLTLPLIFIAIVARRVWIALLLAGTIVLVAATVPNWLAGTRRPFTTVWAYLWLNSVAALAILTVGRILRMTGHRLQ